MKSKPDDAHKSSKSKHAKPSAPPAGSASARPTPKTAIQELGWLLQHRDEYRTKLFQNIKAQLRRLEKLLAKTDEHWGMEDGIYRFYHQSFKVYYVQALTEEICKALAALLPDRPMNKWFMEIVKEGTGHQFHLSHNKEWTRHTRPIVEAAFHAHYFLKMACKYGGQLKKPPDAMPSGWASVLYLFNLR